MSGKEPNSGTDPIPDTLIGVLVDMLGSALRWEAGQPDDVPESGMGTAPGLTEEPPGLNCPKATPPSDLESEPDELL